MNRFIIAICTMLASCGIGATAHAHPTFPDRGRAGVVDAAGVMPDAAVSALNRRVVAWDNSTGHQLVVVTVPSLGGATIADYGVALGRKWGLGHSGSAFNSDGVILLLAPNERKVRIEVGYGLEPVLTDALTSEIIRAQIVPKLKVNDVAGALDAGTSAIMAAASAPQRDVPAQLDEGSVWPWLIAALAAFLGIGALLVRRARRKAESAEAAEAARATEIKVDPTQFAPIPMPEAILRTPRKQTVDLRSNYERRTAPIPPPAESYGSPGYDSSYFSSSTDSSDSGSSWGGSDSSSSFDSGFDSGGGSFGGGGSDSSY